ncbi:gem-associated protein 6-like [Lingula anatina]|uniref:Gem-associated protein 6-like n=1 Tax=Lingula anatina TaxID=7574 RepID=A0A1S3I7R6_LINAN|nr:gem-associated protein 6-like [Lingula anatina]|eukprot:XP_013393419.1 gem-associated protein 6-like [Lingula anatina]
MSNGTSEEEFHPIFSRDPAEFVNFVNKEVCVTLEDESQHIGWVYTIDPVTENIILVNFINGEEKLELLMGHAVKDIVILNSNKETHKAELDRMFKLQVVTQLTPEEMKQRQEKLRCWLMKHRIPVQTTDNECLSVSDALVIEPPYTAESCRSTNEIVLGRVQGLIKNMPDQVDDW